MKALLYKARILQANKTGNIRILNCRHKKEVIILK